MTLILTDSQFIHSLGDEKDVVTETGAQRVFICLHRLSVVIKYLAFLSTVPFLLRGISGFYLILPVPRRNKSCDTSETDAKSQKYTKDSVRGSIPQDYFQKHKIS